MSAPVVSPPEIIPQPLRNKKRVLLVDTSRPKRDLRAETMRHLGIEVDCAADVAEARCWWRADLYDLVLINVQQAVGPRDKFCGDMRKATPGQQIMFLVGKPEYLAAAPNGVDSPLQDATHESPGALKSSLAANPLERIERWGILEACRQISAVRHVSDARAKAIRERPLPPRDSELSNARRTRLHDLPNQLPPETAQ